MNVIPDMDNNGQLTFYDDPLLNESNEIFQLISEGKFHEAIKKTDHVMGINPDYPGIAEAYRTARFWSNREKEFRKLPEGKGAADFLMEEWASFDDYASLKEMKSSSAYKSAMRYIFFKAAEHYRLAIQYNQETGSRFDLLTKLGECFLRLREHKFAVETLEFARSSYRSSARLLFILGESYYHTDDLPKCLLCYREAFAVDPSEIDLSLVEAVPVKDIIKAINDSGRNFRDIREWIPVFGFLTDIFYVRRNLNKHQVESIKREVVNLETSLTRLGLDEIESTNILPRMLNKYLWLLDYYEHQNRNPENTEQIRSRLIALDSELFSEYFRKPQHRRHF